MKYFFFLFLLSSPLQLYATELEAIDVTTSVLESEYLSPVPINVIDEKEFQVEGASRLQEALYLQEGISFVRSGTKLAPSIRGFNPEHTLFLTNGQRLANEPSNKYDLERLLLTDVERIEVIKGPLSTIYGADALGGVINLVTKRIEKDAAQLHLRNGTYDFKSPRNAASIQLDKKLNDFGLRVFATHVKEDALLFNERESIDDEKEINTAGVAMEYRKGRFSFRGRQSWSRDLHESLYFNFLNSSYVYDEDKHRRGYSSGEFVFQQERVRHISTLTYTSYRKHGDTHLQATDALLMTKRARIYVTEATHRSEVNFDHHLLTLGASHRREDYYGNAFNYENHSRYLPEYNSLFVVNQWAVTDRLLLVPSARYEGINYFKDKLLGQIGATLFLDDRQEQNLKFNFAQGYRVPTPKDLYVDLMIMKGNANLAPETTNSYNLEYNLLKTDTSVRVGYFYNHVNDMIQEHFDPGLGKFTFRNAHESVIQGLEAQLRRRFKRHENSLIYTYLEAQEEDGGRLPNRARHHPIFNTTFFMGAVALSNDVSCRFDELLFDEDNELKEFSYCSFDLGATYQFKKYQLVFKGTNLFDHFERGIPQRPRLLTVALNATF